MNYEETLAYLYAQLPMYQRVGAVAHTKSLANIEVLLAAMGNPESRFPSVHVAGTNGKGSSSHLVAAVLQAAGYRVGLYTSPHLREFTERVKINGQELTPGYLVAWVARWQPLFAEVKPSFFEMTVALAFQYFAESGVDIALVEVGLGGRLDSTNVITPLVSLITNISFDHMALLGDTLPLIAREKAGIIKPGVPVVVSQRQPEVAAVFKEQAAAQRAPLTFASAEYAVALLETPAFDAELQRVLVTTAAGPQEYELGLVGDYQRLNLPGVLATVAELRRQGWAIPDDALRTGLRHVSRLTGLRGRWTILGRRPLVVCDTGHNEAGLALVMQQLARVPRQRLHLVLGTVNDKDVPHMLDQLPREAEYYFCQAQIPRALPAPELAALARLTGRRGQSYATVPAAVAAARAAAAPDDVIFIGGSTFVVAEIPDL